MTDDLVRQILAAIEETEQDAQAAVDSAGEAWRVSYFDQDRELALVSGAESPHYDVTETIGDAPQAYATHIARHDPASVLRRCAADRRILERHRPRTARYGPYEGQLICGCLPDGEDEYNAVPFFCDDIRDIADGYGVALTVEPTQG